MKVSWARLVRFTAVDGPVLRGEPILPCDDYDLGKLTEGDEIKAKVVMGDDPFDTTGKTVVSDEVVTIKKLLSPLAQDEVLILRCVGLNYTEHSKSITFTSILYPKQRYRRVKVLMVVFRSSQGSWQNAAAVSIHLLQTQHHYCGSRWSCDNTQNHAE